MTTAPDLRAYVHDPKAARERLNLNQAEMAQPLGYKAATRISEVENGKTELSTAARRLLTAYLSGYRPDDWPETAIA